MGAQGGAPNIAPIAGGAAAAAAVLVAAVVAAAVWVRRRGRQVADHPQQEAVAPRREPEFKAQPYYGGCAPLPRAC